ncbi:MAG: PAS domain-containing sensor histidine kinase [Clostridia bacterium BRH_c25]|nr:MAG: PAS domain-containing sensor histidine kinase [Clostridia bacterium BRH_c25]
MLKTLKGKITLVYTCLVLMIAIIGSASVLNLYRLSKAIDGLMVDNYKSINAISYMLEAFERQDSATLIYINVDIGKGIELFTQNSNEFMKWYITASNNTTETGEKELLNKVNKDYMDYSMLFSKLQEIRNKEGADESAYFYDTEMMPEFVKIKNELRELTHLNEVGMFSSKDEATKSTHESMYVILALSALAVTGGLLLSIHFTNRFMKPLDKLTTTIKSVKMGNWNQQINVVSRDEIGELSIEFNKLTKRLYQYEQSALGKLMTEKNKSLAIVKSIPDPLIVLDTAYRILLLNDTCEMFFGIEEKKVLKKHFLEAIRNEEIFEIVSNAFEDMVEMDDRIIKIEHKEEYYFNVIVTVIKDRESRVTGLIILLKDVTQLKQLEKARTDFVSTISHEFKTPLTSIMMGTSMVLDGSMGTLNEEQQDVMNTIKEDGERLTRLVNDLLELSRIESGSSAFDMEPCSIDTVIDNSVKQFAIQAAHKSVSISTRIEENMPKVIADNEKITWVFNNLISNALKYTNPGDEIVIDAFIENGKMHVSVKDTGIGIPEEFQEKIFDKYVQVRGQDLEARGTGLGLAVVKEIINTHGGEIWCESKMDTGSIFTFTLPLSFLEVPGEKNFGN